MKKVFLTTILGVALLCSCSSDTAVSPAIKMESCTVNGELVSGTPSVKAGDVVELALDLEGNGSELQSFQAAADADKVKIALADYEKNRVTDDKNFTDTIKCRLRFVDGVTVSSVKVKATVQSDTDDKMALKFYLSAKADCEGSVLEVDLKKDNAKE